MTSLIEESNRLATLSHKQFMYSLSAEDHSYILDHPVYGEDLYYERVRRHFPSCIYLFKQTFQRSWKHFYYELISLDLIELDLIELEVSSKDPNLIKFERNI